MLSTVLVAHCWASMGSPTARPPWLMEVGSVPPWRMHRQKMGGRMAGMLMGVTSHHLFCLVEQYIYIIYNNIYIYTLLSTTFIALHYNTSHHKAVHECSKTWDDDHRNCQQGIQRDQILSTQTERWSKADGCDTPNFIMFSVKLHNIYIYIHRIAINWMSIPPFNCWIPFSFDPTQKLQLLYCWSGY